MVRCTAMINPSDADRLKIGDGDDISVSTRIGEIKLPAEITDKMVKVKALSKRREIVTITAKPVTILYGSRTGNAEALASDVARKAEAHDMAAIVYAMEDIEVLIIAS